MKMCCVGVVSSIGSDTLYQQFGNDEMRHI